MLTINSNQSQFLHRYEAFQMPQKNANATKSKTEEKNNLSSTPNAEQQLVKDKIDYKNRQKAGNTPAAEGSQAEGMKQYTQQQAKALTAFRSLAKGDRVSPTDERKLMEFEPKLYQTAKMSQSIAQQAAKTEAQLAEKAQAKKKEDADQLKKKSEDSLENITLNPQKSQPEKKETAAETENANNNNTNKMNTAQVQSYAKFTQNTGNSVFETAV